MIALILQQMLGYNVEALAQDEGYNKGDKLKSVSCTCPNNKSGFSLKCRADGNLEQCTPTRQTIGFDWRRIRN